jgi:hypothetical protein
VAISSDQASVTMFRSALSSPRIGTIHASTALETAELFIVDGNLSARDVDLVDVTPFARVMQGAPRIATDRSERFAE